jgi:hypothetical protein
MVDVELSTEELDCCVDADIDEWIESVLEQNAECKKTRRHTWTVDDDSVILAHVEEHGRTWRQLAKAGVLNKSEDAIRNRYHRLVGLQADRGVAARKSSSARPTRHVPWTTHEDDIIRKYRSTTYNKWIALQTQLPTRTVHAVRNRAMRLTLGYVA